VDYDPANHLVKVVKAADNKPLEKDYETQQEVIKKKPYKQPRSKVLKTSSAGDGPIIEVNDSLASMRGNADYGFFSYREGAGNIIKGPISFGAAAQQMKFQGLHTLNPIALSGFPSTIVTPIPTFLWALPAAAAVKPLLKDITVMGTLVSAFGVS
jgi:hypothetical protein